MSVTNGPICSTNEPFGDNTTENSPWLLSTKGSTIRICTPDTPGGNSMGLPGELRWDEDFIYVCVALNTWKRAPLIIF